MSTLHKNLLKKFPELVGTINIKEISNMLMIEGSVSVQDPSKFEKELTKQISKIYPNQVPITNLSVNTFTLTEDSISTNKEYSNDLDEVEVLYYGLFPVNHIVQNGEFKLFHEINRQKLDNIIKVLNFISPIILDSDLKVIDGNFRLQLAISNNIAKVPVVIIDDNGKKAQFLRLALNRTAEFQRWNYRQIDDYVDDTPQAQPILEPIGFFGKKVLPTSFFADTVVQYVIDPYNEKQKQYSQEEGLAEWAKYRREQMAKLSEEKRSKKDKKENAISLFDLLPKESDFLETYDFEETQREYLDKWKNIAGTITDTLDEKKKKELEETGGVWQTTHRSSAQKAADTKKKAIEKIKSYTKLTEDEKAMIIDNIDDYADHYRSENRLIEMVRSEDE